MEKNEKSKFIPWYEWVYSIWENGTIYSHLYGNIKILKTYMDKDWYAVVVLYKEWKRKYTRVHRLLAMTYIRNHYSLPVVNHIDGNKKNNTISNLEWSSISDNNLHAYRLWLKKITKHHNFFTNHPTKWLLWSKNHNSKPVSQYSKEGVLIKVWWSTMDIQRELNIKNTNVSACCLWKVKSAGWYIWKYC